MKKVTIMFLVLLSILFAQTSQVIATEACTGKVTGIETNGLPAAFYFTLDCSVSNCPAGSWLLWLSSADNNKATYAGLLASLTSGRATYVSIDTSNCKAVNIKLQ